MKPPDELTDLLVRAHATHATDPSESVQCGRAALALADSGGDLGLRIRARRTLAAALSRLDEGREADALLHEALVLLVETPDEVERGRVLSWLAALDARAGQLDSATRAILTARQLLAGSEDAEAVAGAEWLYGVILMLGGDLAGALERTEAARAIALVHARQLLPMILSNLAAVHGELGDPRRAIESLQFAARLLDSSRDGKTRSNVHTNLCVAYAQLGEFEAAMRHGELAVAHGREVGSGPSEAEALQNMAELSERMGDVPGALERIQEALDRLPSSRWQATEVGVRARRGALLSLSGKTYDAIEELKCALYLAESLGLRAHEYQIHEALASAYESQGDLGRALHHYKRHLHARTEVWSNEQQQRLRAALIRAEMLQFERDAELLRAHNQALAQSNEEKVALLAQLEAQRGHLERLSLEDPLTGLANRRSLDTQLDRELARAERFGHPLSIAMLDVDHFKSVNDDYSHTTGDAVLRAIAACLRVRMRSVDVVARYGGEEFVMVFVETSLDDSRRVAEELRAAVESADWSELVPGRSVTVSIGVAATTERATARGLLALADARLYEAKAQGRNRVR